MRLIDADEIMEFPYNETSGTDEKIDEWIDKALDCGLTDEIYFRDEYRDELRELCWLVIEGMLSVVETAETVEVPLEGEENEI